MIVRKKVNRLKWILGCSNYRQETKTKAKNINQATNNYKNGRLEIPILNLICHVNPGNE